MTAPLALLALAAAPAEAAVGPEYLPAGTMVEVVSVGRRDAFWLFREEIVGLVCRVEEPGLARHRGRWYGGEVICTDGQTYYFYQVGIATGDYGDALLAIAAAQTAVAGAPSPGDAGAGRGEAPATDASDAALPRASTEPRARADAPSASAGGPPPAWPPGARGRIRAVSTADATFVRKPSVVGMTCTVSGEPLLPSGDGWYSGPLRCDDGKDWFFFQVELEPVAAADAGGGAAAAAAADAGSSAPAGGGAARKADGRLTGTPVPAGRLVRVVDIGPGDLYHRDRSTLLGVTCTVVEAPLMPTGEVWYAGRLFCADGVERQLFQVSVAPE